MFKLNLSAKTRLLSGVSLIAITFASPVYATTLGSVTGQPTSAVTTAPVTAAPITGGITTTVQTPGAIQSTKDFTNALAAIQSQISAQAAARAAANAAPSNVPNGLVAGGLVVDPRVVAGTDPNLWVNANAPEQTVDSANQTTVTIQQTSQRAVMTWQSFNVGKNTTVHFDQSAGNSSAGNSWVALNRIDASGSPSQIFGQIKAEGSVYLINPNGVIFGGTSQVNVHSLLVSSMDLNSTGQGTNVGVYDGNGSYVNVSVNGAIQRADDGTVLLAPINEDSGNKVFLGSGLFANASLGTGGGNMAMFSQGALKTQTDQGVQVQAGASISTVSGVSGFDNGGFVALIGPQVKNAGSISTSAGSIVLAASNNIFLSEPPSGSTTVTAFTAANTTSNIYLSFVWSGAPSSTGSAAINDTTGLLLAKRGNITLFGDQVSQLGVAEATTSITRAGSIVLYGPSLTTLGPNSLTAILPEENGETIPSDVTSLANFTAPSITVTATKFDMQANALVYAPGASMTISPIPSNLGTGDNPLPTGRLLLEAGAEIDLGGLNDVAVPVSQWLYTFKVTANDVADTPLAQSLIGQTVTIDLSLSGTRTDGETWVGSPLFASSGAGYLATLPQTIDQLLTKGGNLTLGGNPYVDVLTAPGSGINVSGGSIRYSGASVVTTTLMGSDGRIYSIGGANPFITYTGVAGTTTDAADRWAVSTTYTNDLLSGSYYKSGYVDGVSAGNLTVWGTYPLLDGDILASLLISDSQRLLGQTATGTNGTQLTPDQIPTGSSLTITLQPGANAYASNAVIQEDADNILSSGFTINSVFDLTNGGTTGGVIALPAGKLTNAGFSSIKLAGAFDVSMAKGAVLVVNPGGSVTLSNVSTIDGTIIAHGGKISLSGYSSGSIAYVNSPSEYWSLYSPALVIGPDAVLDVSGLWVNDFASGSITGSAYINGGTISITTNTKSTYIGGKYDPDPFNGVYTVNNAVDVTQSIVLSAGSVIDVSSGGYIGTNGKLKTGSDGLPSGKGGNLKLVTYNGNWLDHGDGIYNAAYNGYVCYCDVKNGAIAPFSPNTPNTASIYMGGTIYANGFSSGGTLTLQAPTIAIGGAGSTATSYFSNASAARLSSMTGVAASSFTTSDVNAGTIVLPSDFFKNSGFGNYALTSTYGSITVTGTTTLQQTNYLALANSDGVLWSLPTGSSLHGVVPIGLAPDGLRNPVSLSLTERGYLDGVAGDISTTAGILIDTGAELIADAGNKANRASISLTADGPVTILGSITAPGGSVTATSSGLQRLKSTFTDCNNNCMATTIYTGTSQASQDVWLGPDAVIDVSGTFVADPTLGYTSGTVLAGGTVTLSSTGSVITMPGSLIDISGADAIVDVPTGLAGLVQQESWSNGGSLIVAPGYTSSNVTYYPNAYLAGTIDAAGGSSKAAGGSLSLGQVNVTATNYGTYTTSLGAYTSVILTQSGDVTSGFATALGSSPYPLTPAQISALTGSANTTAYITADTLNNSHLDTVSIYGKIGFAGNVSLTLPGTLNLGGKFALLPAGSTNVAYTASCTGTDCIPSIGDTNVTLNAGYIRLLGTGSGTPALGDGTITFNAKAQIDVGGYVTIANAGQVNLISGGDIRFVSSGESDIAFISGAALVVADDLTLTARTVYPVTNQTYALVSAGTAPNTTGHDTITILSNGQTPVAPLSAGGTLLVDAATIVQGGALYVPLGTIQLGYNSGQTVMGYGSAIATNTLTLAAGSTTSVSANGLSIPDGTTTDGANWLSAPPAKLILLNGGTVTAASGAVIDGSGGGDIYAVEFVPGTGGSRNVLADTNTTYSGTTAVQTSLYPDGRQVYAIVPSYEAPIAAYDSTFDSLSSAYNPTFTSKNLPGSAITIAGGNGIAAGTYVLMPAMYATLPGAYRVVVLSTNAGTGTASTALADGTVNMRGTLTNTINGSSSSQTALLQIQSNAAWTKYSEIDIASGDTYFANQATTNGTVAPRLAVDAGQLSIAALNALTLNSSNNFKAGDGGLGGQIDITGTNLLVAASDLKDSLAASSAYSGYLILDADQLSGLGAESLLIGGTRSTTNSGTQITPTASDVEVATDAAHPLTGPELLLVSKAPTGVSTSSNGVTIDGSSVLAAKGTVSSAATPIVFASGSSDGSLLRLSNGSIVTITRQSVPSVTYGKLTVGAKANLTGNSLTLDSSGTTVTAPDAILSAKNYDLSANLINLGGGSGGLVLSSGQINAFAGAQSVLLRSASVFNLYGNNSFGSAATPIGTLTLDGAGLYSDGGTVGMTATNIVFKNSQTTANTTGANVAGSNGSLVLSASDTVTLGAGTKTTAGFSNINVTGGKQVMFAGTGSLDAGASAVTFTAPALVANLGSVQSVKTTGGLTIAPASATAPVLAVNNIGGTLTLTGSSIADSGTILAQGGIVTLEATAGDVVLDGTAAILAPGTEIALNDLIEDTPAGTVKLFSDTGNVVLGKDTLIDVSAQGNGYGGTVLINAAGSASLNGSMKANAAYKDIGGAFTLIANTMSGQLPLSGFTGSFTVRLGSGDIAIASGQTLASDSVLLVTNNGSITVDGTIDASGTSGGSIALYAAGTKNGGAVSGGVNIGSGAKLIAKYVADDKNDPAYSNGESALVQTGGTITLGTTGTPDGTLNAAYGYENVPTSGAINVASGAIFDVSGGPGGTDINNTGGSVVVRAPILANNNVNVSFKGTLVTNADTSGNASGDGIVLDAFAVWSTTDAGGASAKHFDGIIDPAGFFDASGNQIVSASSGLYPTSTYAAPANGAYLPHVGFYQNTLVNFVNDPFNGNGAAVAADFSGAKLQVGTGTPTALPASMLHIRPEVDLVNPSTSINSGNITVASNWNLGAGLYNTATGAFSLYYRTTAGGEPGVLALRAANNVQVNATISDGFYETSDPMYGSNYPTGLKNDSLTAAQTEYTTIAKYSGGTYMPGAEAVAAPPTTFPSGYNQDDKNAWYGTYYDVYASTTTSYPGSRLATLDGAVASRYVTVLATGSGSFDNNPNHYANYAAYIAAYNANYVGTHFVSTEKTTTFTASLSSASKPALKTQYLYSFDNKPADYGSYADYVLAYNAYATKMRTTLQTYYASNKTIQTDITKYPTTVLAPVPPTLNMVFASGAVESGPQFTTDYKTSYAASAYNSYATAYSSYRIEPGYVTGNTSSTATTSAGGTTGPLWLIAIPYLPAVSETPVIQIASSATAGPGNQIANNPAVNTAVNNRGVTVNINDYNTTSAASLMPASLGSSFTYDMVGGAVFNADGTSSVDPNAVVAAATLTGSKTGDVTLNGHSSYSYTYNSKTGTIDIPTIVRTGTGDITITAAGSFELLDQIRPGVVYTAGTASASAAGFTPLTLLATQTHNGLVADPVWGSNGGSVSISAGKDIIGIETPYDVDGSQLLPFARSSAADTTGMSTGQLWTAWYESNGKTSGSTVAPFDPTQGGSDYSTWVNYQTFFQGIGALGGGNITLNAARNIYDISASLPETIQVTGGTSLSNPSVAHYYGGGNLVVNAGGNLYSSAFFVGRGTGTINVGGVVAADMLNPITGQAARVAQTNYYNGMSILDENTQTYATYFTVPLLLAEQDGYITIRAQGSVAVGDVIDPGLLSRDSLYGSATTSTGYSLLSNANQAKFATMGPNSGVKVTSVAGDVTFTSPGYAAIGALTSHNGGNSGNGSYDPYGSTFDNLDAEAITGNIVVSDNITLNPSAFGNLVLAAGQSITVNNLSGNCCSITMNDGAADLPAVLGYPQPTVLSEALHDDDTVPAIIYAGTDITSTTTYTSITLLKPARVWAGRDIYGLTFTGQNNNAGELTSLIAGRDLGSKSYGIRISLYGPGDLLVAAGRNLGPFLNQGIRTLGNGSNDVTIQYGNAYMTIKPYLPVEGANITALFGVGSGIDYAAATANYIDPVKAGTDGISYLSDIAKLLGVSEDQAWITFQGLSPLKQEVLIDRAFLDFLTQVSRDYADPSSSYYLKYGRAYQTIATLFPTSLGYTANDTGESNGASTMVHTGNLYMAGTLIETQAGGDINILGPGGTIYVGTNAADTISPSQEGILTLQGGNIRTYTDGSVEVYQSRVFTEQGGDIDMFSANADLNAGKGPKSKAAYPPLQQICDSDGYCRVSPAGLVTGAGIGALISVPGQDPAKSNVVLSAPHGTVDAGAAGIRAAGDLYVIALHVLNAFNIDVGGKAFGVPTAPTMNLSLADVSAASTDTARLIKELQPHETHATIDVEVTGFGDEDPCASPKAPRERCPTKH